jgi:hypothetical protein
MLFGGAFLSKVCFVVKITKAGEIYNYTMATLFTIRG